MISLFYEESMNAHQSSNFSHNIKLEGFANKFAIREAASLFKQLFIDLCYKVFIRSFIFVLFK